MDSDHAFEESDEYRQEEEFCDNPDGGPMFTPISPSGYDNIHQRPHQCAYAYPQQWISDATMFCCEDTAVAAVNEYQSRNQCPLVMARGGGRPDLSKGKKGKLNFQCIHGIKNTRPSKKKALVRKKQHTNYRECLMKIYILSKSLIGSIMKLCIFFCT